MLEVGTFRYFFSENCVIKASVVLSQFTRATDNITTTAELCNATAMASYN